VTVTEHEGGHEAEEHESLEAERDFLLRSLDDLEANHDAGDMDDETYERLRADYTARAAAVIRTLRDGVDSRPDTPRPSRRRRVAVVSGLVAFAVAASVALAAGLGARLPGQTVTGNTQSKAGDSREAGFKAAVQARPNDPQAHLAYARYLLAAQNYAEAIKQYDATARLDPKNAEARAYGAWIVFLADLPDEALTRVDAAIAADPRYPDAHFFKGMILFRGKSQPCPAKGEFQQYLAVANQSDLAPQVESVLAEAVKACPDPATTPSTSPTTKP
jgi:tetratricopeptide (TPR) repeat protein